MNNILHANAKFLLPTKEEIICNGAFDYWRVKIFVRGRIQIFIILANYIWKYIEHYQGNYNGALFYVDCDVNRIYTISLSYNSIIEKKEHFSLNG